MFSAFGFEHGILTISLWLRGFLHSISKHPFSEGSATSQNQHWTVGERASVYPGASYKRTVCSEPQMGKPWCFPSTQEFSGCSQQLPSYTDFELLIRLMPASLHGGWETAAFAKRSCSRLFRVSAGQEVHYFEHYNEGNPVSQLQNSDFTKGLFFFSLDLKANGGLWTLDGNSWRLSVSSASRCGRRLSSDHR